MWLCGKQEVGTKWQRGVWEGFYSEDFSSSSRRNAASFKAGSWEEKKYLRILTTFEAANQGLACVQLSSLPCQLDWEGLAMSGVQRVTTRKQTASFWSSLVFLRALVVFFSFHFKSGSIKNLLPLPKSAASVYDPADSLTTVTINRFILLHFALWPQFVLLFVHRSLCLAKSWFDISTENLYCYFFSPWWHSNTAWVFKCFSFILTCTTTLSSTAWSTTTF